jgi:hypothetical protein
MDLNKITEFHVSRWLRRPVYHNDSGGSSFASAKKVEVSAGAIHPVNEECRRSRRDVADFSGWILLPFGVISQKRFKAAVHEHQTLVPEPPTPE